MSSILKIFFQLFNFNFAYVDLTFFEYLTAWLYRCQRISTGRTASLSSPESRTVQCLKIRYRRFIATCIRKLATITNVFLSPFNISICTNIQYFNTINKYWKPVFFSNRGLQYLTKFDDLFFLYFLFAFYLLIINGKFF